MNRPTLSIIVAVLPIILFPLRSVTAQATVSAERLAAILAGAPPTNKAELRAMERHVIALAKRTLPAVVSLPGASGVLLRDGYALTAAHVSRGLERRRRSSATLHDGEELEIEPLGRDDRADAGLIRITSDNAKSLPGLPMGKSSELRIGEWCLMLGHPRGKKSWRPASVRLGRIVGLDADRHVTSDCTMESGDSGGPLLDMNGQIIGINSRITRDLTTNVHAPIDSVRDGWDALKGGDRIRGRMSRVRNDDADGPTRYDDAVRRAFRESVKQARRSVVDVRIGGESVGLGCVVHADGFVVTKLSALSTAPAKDLSCRLGDQTFAARLVGRDTRDDLALLRIGAKGLATIAWTTDELPVGSWVITPSREALPVSYGVVSTPIQTREHRAMLGVRFRVSRRYVKIRSVVPGSAAAEAGIRPGDIIRSIDGKRVRRASAAKRALRGRELGEVVRLEVQRGAETLEKVARLAPDRSGGGRNRQSHLWGDLSDVRGGFSGVLQHDGILKPTQCGGPLLDLDGRCVGINLARSSRIESVALPAKIARAKIKALIQAARKSREL